MKIKPKKSICDKYDIEYKEYEIVDLKNKCEDNLILIFKLEIEKNRFLSIDTTECEKEPKIIEFLKNLESDLLRRAWSVSFLLSDMQNKELDNKKYIETLSEIHSDVNKIYINVIKALRDINSLNLIDN